MESSAADSPRGLDLDALRDYLDRVAPGLVKGPLSGQLLAGGRSNLTYLVTDGSAEWVVRRPPLGHVLETAHDMRREHRVMAALSASSVPVPEMVALCQDPEVLDAPFYVMSYLSGPVYRTAAQLRRVDAGSATKLADGLVDTLAVLHEVDVDRVGLSDLGRPEGYLDRQVRRWTKQLASSRSRDVPGIEDLGRRLAGSVPFSQRTSLVHGDYKLDNVVIDPKEPGHVLAVLDWEMATLGDPVMDIVNAVLWWDGVYDADGRPFAAVPADVAAFPSSTRLLERYASRTGTDLASIPWYLGLAHYKLAAIFEGMYYRHVQGLTVGEGFDRLSGLAPALVQRGHDALEHAALPSDPSLPRRPTTRR